VIRFRCMYCGEKLRGGDGCLGKKLRCPKCRRVIRVSKANIIKENVNKPTYKQKKASVVTDNFRKRRWTRKDNERIAFYKRILVPQFDELTLFLMVVIAVLLLVTNQQMRISILDFAGLAEIFPGVILLLLIILAGGLPLSVYHVFSRRQKSSAEKMMMVGFAVLITAMSGIFAGLYMLKSSAGLGLIFPAWNLVNAIFIIVLRGLEVINEDSLVDKDASLMQVVIGLAILLVVFVLCQYVFDLYWAVTMSVCVAYSTNFTIASECKAEADKWG